MNLGVMSRYVGRNANYERTKCKHTAKDSRGARRGRLAQGLALICKGHNRRPVSTSFAEVWVSSASAYCLVSLSTHKHPSLY